MGIAAMVLGILATLLGINPAFFLAAGPLGVIALVLGILGHKMAATEGKPTGTATAGIVLGACGLVFAVFWYVTCHMLISKTKNAVEKNFTAPLKKAIEEAEKKERADRDPGLRLDRAGAIRLTAEKLASEWESNEYASKSRYRDKTLEVSGVVEKVTTRYGTGFVDVLLDGSVAPEAVPKKKPHKRKVDPDDEDDDAEDAEASSFPGMGDVTCRLVKADTQKAQALEKGARVTVLGVATDGLLGPALRGCVLK
jgi:hypothetical protein